jgi:hypothetical protein
VNNAWRREWTGLATIAPPCMPHSMDRTELNLAVPSHSWRSPVNGPHDVARAAPDH